MTTPGFEEARQAALEELEGQQPTEEEEETPADPGNPDPEGDSEGDPDPDDPPQDPEEEQGEVPTEYMGVDLSAVEDPEARKNLISSLRENDKFIQSVLRRNKELEEKAGDPPANPEPSEEEPQAVDVDSILQQMYGSAEEDPLFDVKAEAAKPLLELLVPMAQQLQEMAERDQVREFATNFHSTLDRMEDEYGRLPDEITRDDILDYMAENNVSDPEIAFIKATSSARQTLSKGAAAAAAEAARRAKENAAKKRVTTKRPGPGGDTEISPKGVSVREAVLAAAKEQNFDLDKASQAPWAGAV